ncbi:MAG: multidrug ABC transporter ATP-binding protein [Flammeovirgaceae bacterium]|nr:multidrug ABC transporter ATP-binding protein [Flammeovirgaceae bacterium]MBE62239.1 multidrug ABC transporter ATP-binding protein [Flammeovirgaceae bacterium]HCX21490.1 multidrug ABC transporter ATP-binding protein [Cytophagales bacterium]|tara:strand:+ start:7193 stop:8968 length:1776 start_codon:yes stop_codon:yes gene_type:complete
MSGKEQRKKISKDGFKNLLGIFQYMWPYKVSFIIGLVLLIISSSIFMVFPYVSGKLVDLATGSENWFADNIGTAALILLGILFFQSIVSFFRVVLFARVTENAMANMRIELYERMIALPITFFDKHRTGDLISRISNDVSTLQSTFSTTLAELIRQFIILITGIGLIFFLTPSLSVFMLATFPVIIVSAFFFGKFIRKLSKQTQVELADANVIVEETMQSIHAVKSYTSEAFEMLRYGSKMRSVVKTALKVANWRGAFISFIIFMIFGGIVAILWYGAKLVQSGEMTVGDLIQFILYTTFIGASIAGLGDLFGQVSRAVGAAERIFEIQDEIPEWEESKAAKTAGLNGDIQFSNIQFSYPTRPEVQVLKEINLKIQKGQKIALVGHSGAGKSTIVQLLMKFYPVDGGAITIGGQDISQLDVQSLRSHIGIVPQEVILFGGTIEENIRYGKPDATHDEVVEAARKANALDFIQKFPEQFETTVGERGIKLSGGQRQRIAIARAVLKDPDVLILDEATSSLDAESEHLVQQALNQLMEGRTTIIIAHRLATIRSVDCIYVLDKGEIVESGTHEELLTRNQGSYKNFIELQLQD